MAAPLGNSFWRARSKHGRNPKFATPEDLWDACVEYFEWVEDNPLYAAELVSYQGQSTIESVPKMRAMTITALCLFLDITTVTWRDYAAKEDFSSVTTRAEAVIRSQKFEGASAGFLNANIIARDLGLADKSEISGAGGGPIEVAEVTDREAARRIAMALAKGTPEGA